MRFTPHLPTENRIMALSFEDLSPDRGWAHYPFQELILEWVSRIEVTIDKHLSSGKFLRVRDQFGLAEIKVNIFSNDLDAESEAEELRQMEDWCRNEIVQAVERRFYDVGWDEVRIDANKGVIFLVHSHERLR